MHILQKNRKQIIFRQLQGLCPPDCSLKKGFQRRKKNIFLRICKKALKNVRCYMGGLSMNSLRESRKKLSAGGHAVFRLPVSAVQIYFDAARVFGLPRRLLSEGEKSSG